MIHIIGLEINLYCSAEFDLPFTGQDINGENTKESIYTFHKQNITAVTDSSIEHLISHSIHRVCEQRIKHT